MELKEKIEAIRSLDNLRSQVIYWTQQLEKAENVEQREYCFKNLEKFVSEMASQVAKYKYNHLQK
ncbi:hypothetical protein P4H70_12305 [Paenibacillus ehimensis]|uniref:hypothetical protein n=1 Tax=Paenibacillus ehimensis TaxID=79264 RepID=UPI002DB6A5F9|nr:hypothetical protein [Paenibacillus ehimensis]MEC0209713.1 hypothetical protein [Paenibacillus ehimensis]